MIRLEEISRLKIVIYFVGPCLIVHGKYLIQDKNFLMAHTTAKWAQAMGKLLVS